MVETHTASKLNQGLKKLQITLGTRSSPQDNEATSVSQHASYSTSFISTSSAGRAPSLARWPWHTRDHPHLNHATDVEGNNNLTGSSQPAPSRSNIKGLKIRIGKHVKKGWNDPMSPRETSKHASLPYPQNYGSLQVDGQPSTPPTESGIALLPHLDFLSSHSPTSASSFMSVASEPAVGRTSVASYLPQVKPTTGRLLIPEEWRRLPSSPELHIVGTSLHESPVAQTSLVGPGNSFLRADQNSSMPNRPPPIPHGSRRNSHASSVQSTINEVTAFPERSRPHSIYTHVSKPSDTSSFYGTYFQDESQWSTQDASANEAFTVVSGTGSGNASFSSAALEPGECGKSQVVRLPSSPDGEEAKHDIFLQRRYE
ncbi:hypothetical protein K439DRAFT_298300 [Ramaria rubella]|nr:hypothetical protein K439DRAFT_298300 [Ramaria rubella]